MTHGAVCRSLIRTIAPESLSVAILGGNKAIPTIQFSIGDGYTFLLTVPVFGSPSACSTSLSVVFPVSIQLLLKSLGTEILWFERTKLKGTIEL